MIRKIKNIDCAVPLYGRLVQTLRGTVSITRQVTCTWILCCYDCFIDSIANNILLDVCSLCINAFVVEHRDFCYDRDLMSEKFYKEMHGNKLIHHGCSF